MTDPDLEALKLKRMTMDYPVDAEYTDEEDEESEPERSMDPATRDRVLRMTELDDPLDSDGEEIAEIVRELQAADETRTVLTEPETRALGNKLKHFWTRDPEGLAKWAKSPHPWTALYRHLLKYVGSARAKRIAAQWHKEVFGIWPGEKKGQNPVGPG